MRIVLLTTYPHGGAGIACRRLENALRHIGLEAQTLTAADAPSRWPFYAERLSFLPFERDRSVRFQFSLANFGCEMARHPVVQEADIIHLHWINQGFLSLQNIRQLAQTGKPIVWTLHDMWAFTGGCHHSAGCEEYTRACGHCPMLRWRGPRDLSHRIWQRKRRLFPQHMHIITCSEWLGQRARRSSLLGSYPIQVLPNAIDTGLFAPASEEQRRAFRHARGIADTAVLALFSSVKVENPWKGFGHLARALAQLRQQKPDLPLELMVMGKAQPETLSRLPCKVHELGALSDASSIAEAYAAADLFVIPSLEENLPNTVMEALACGTPVAGFRTGGIPEMVEHEQNGFLAPVGNSQALAEAIIWVAQRAGQLRAAARSKAERCYAQTIVAHQHLALYQQALERSPR
ncbi:MAG: glycosyltransferase family 4 protein [Saprospiraceae bacterium]|nr:glycosyltransferase family 4 protein [Saprospiraceae bacterium]